MTARHLVLASTVFLFVGCAGSTIGYGNSGADHNASATASIARDTDSASAKGLDLEIVQTAAPPVMGGQTSVDVQYTFEIKNTTAAPTTVKRITIWSAGGAYEVENRSRTFKKTIAPGAVEKLPFWATARGVSSLTGTQSPVTLRAEVQFQDPEGLQKATFVRTINGHLTIGVSGQ